MLRQVRQSFPPGSLLSGRIKELPAGSRNPSVQNNQIIFLSPNFVPCFRMGHLLCSFPGLWKMTEMGEEEIKPQNTGVCNPNGRRELSLKTIRENGSGLELVRKKHPRAITSCPWRSSQVGKVEPPTLHCLLYITSRLSQAFTDLHDRIDNS